MYRDQPDGAVPHGVRTAELEGAGGGLQARECLDLLERLEGQGFLTLPGKRVTRSRKCARSIGPTGEEQPWARLAGSVEAFAPVDVELVRSRGQRRLFREFVSQHHYLG
jgi:hypothetical protein